MKHTEAKTRILDVFKRYDYAKLAERGEKHTQSYVIEKLSNGSSIIIYFPGYKSAPSRFGEYTYDYRVDLMLPRKDNFQTTLSHVNVIIDICNKCLQNSSLKPVITAKLNDLYIHGTSGQLVNSLGDYRPVTVSDQLIDIASTTHVQLGKSYNKDGNKYDLTYEELFHSILWISLQEDLNYPMPRFEGRRMSFSRYLESVWQIDSNHTLQEVIQRALSHSMPIPWRNYEYPDKVSQ